LVKLKKNGKILKIKKKALDEKRKSASIAIPRRKRVKRGV
jgi:hypothetical protein